jgi:hypothetical protein
MRKIMLFETYKRKTKYDSWYKRINLTPILTSLKKSKSEEDIYRNTRSVCSWVISGLKEVLASSEQDLVEEEVGFIVWEAEEVLNMFQSLYDNMAEPGYEGYKEEYDECMDRLYKVAGQRVLVISEVTKLPVIMEYIAIY